MPGRNGAASYALTPRFRLLPPTGQAVLMTTAPHPIMVMDVALGGGGSPVRPMRPEEHRDIAEELVLTLLDGGVDVGAWKEASTAASDPPR